MHKIATFFEVVLIVVGGGIVSFIVYTSLSTATQNVRKNDLLLSLNTVVGPVLACLDSGKEIPPAEAGKPVCDTSIYPWPVLTDDWKYTKTSSSLEDRTFIVEVESEMQKQQAQCTEKGCILNRKI